MYSVNKNTWLSIQSINTQHCFMVPFSVYVWTFGHFCPKKSTAVWSKRWNCLSPPLTSVSCTHNVFRNISDFILSHFVSVCRLVKTVEWTWFWNTLMSLYHLHNKTAHCMSDKKIVIRVILFLIDLRDRNLKDLGKENRKYLKIS